MKSPFSSRTLGLAIALAVGGCMSEVGGPDDDGGIDGSGGAIGSGGGAGAGGRVGSGGTTGPGGKQGTGGEWAHGSGGRGSGGAPGSGGHAGAGGAGGGAYKPCPTDGTACKILPLGDSITWGIQYDGAYRVELFNRAVTGAQKITFVGSQKNGPTTVAAQTFPRNNEGHSGWTIAQIDGISTTAQTVTVSGQSYAGALRDQPHIVLLLIGTNDVYATSGQAQMAARLGALLDKITAALPTALVVVGKITPLNNTGWNATIKTYNDAIPGLVQTRVAAGKHIIVADLNTAFTPSMLSTDTIHPNKSGYDWMAGVWYTAIKDLLPK